jgi:hypothetical protein
MPNLFHGKRQDDGDRQGASKEEVSSSVWRFSRHCQSNLILLLRVFAADSTTPAASEPGVKGEGRVPGAIGTR